MSRGVGAALGQEDLSPEWFEALAATAAEAKAMRYRSDSERMEARTRAKIGWR